MGKLPLMPLRMPPFTGAPGAGAVVAGAVAGVVAGVVAGFVVVAGAVVVGAVVFTGAVVTGAGLSQPLKIRMIARTSAKVINSNFFMFK